MKKGYVRKVKAAIRLYHIQSIQWQKNIRYPFRFILCGIFTYCAYELFRSLGKIETSTINMLLERWIEPVPFTLTVILVIYGYMGLGFAVIAAALFNSLLPKS